MPKHKKKIFSKIGNIKPDFRNDMQHLNKSIRIMLGINNLGDDFVDFDITKKCDIFRAVERIWETTHQSNQTASVSSGLELGSFLDSIEIFVTREYFREILTSSCVSNGHTYSPFLYQCVEEPTLLSDEFEYLLNKMQQYDIKSMEVHNVSRDVNLETYMDDVLDDDLEVDGQIMVQHIENHDAELEAKDRERSQSRKKRKKYETSQLFMTLNRTMHDRQLKLGPYDDKGIPTTLDRASIRAIVDEWNTSPPRQGKDKKMSKKKERMTRKRAWMKREKERIKLIQQTRKKHKAMSNKKSRSRSNSRGKAKAKSRSRSNSKGKGKTKKNKKR